MRVRRVTSFILVLEKQNQVLSEPMELLKEGFLRKKEKRKGSAFYRSLYFFFFYIAGQLGISFQEVLY